MRSGNPASFRRCFLAGFITIAALAYSKSVSQETTVLVVDEMPADSAAARAGLKVGDRILTYDEKPLSSPAALQAAEDNTFVKTEIGIAIQRGSETIGLEAPRGRLGIQVRPELPPDVLNLYEDGRAAQRNQKADQAIQSWTAAAIALQRAGSPIASSWMHGRVGDAHESQRQWKPAMESRRTVWELQKMSGDAPSRSRALVAMGRVSVNLNEFQQAENWYQQAVDVDTTAGYPMWVAADLNSLGLAVRSRGDLALSRQHLQRSLEIREQYAPGSLDVAVSLNNLGIVASALGDLVAAQDYNSRAVAIRERLAPNSLLLAASLNNLGIVAWSRGELTQALDYHNRALSIREKLAPDSLDIASTFINLGLVARSRGDFAAAQDYYTRGLVIRERLAPNSLDVAGILNNIGSLARLRGDLAAAQDHLVRALAIKERLSPNSLDVASTLTNLGLVAQNRGDPTQAQDYLSRASVIWEKLAPESPDMAHNLSDLGLLARSRGDSEATRNYYARAAGIWERLVPDSLDFAAGLSNLADVSLEQGRFAEALPLFERAVAIVEAQRWQVRTAESRAMLLARHADSYTGLLSAQLGVNDLPAAYATAERVRARSLLDLLSEARTDIRQGVDPVLLERERELQKQLNAKADRQMQLIRSQHTDQQAADARKELDNLLLQYKELQEQIRAKNPRYAALTQPQPLELTEIQRQLLDDGTLLLQYVLGEDGSYLFAVTTDSIRSFNLPKRTEIEQIARSVHELIMSRQPVASETLKQRQARIAKADAEYPAAAATLSRMVLGPVADQLADKRLLIVADGALQYVPFGALPEPSELASIEPPPLILKHEIVSTPSASVLSSLRREFQDRQPAERQVAVLADPVFDSGDPRLKLARDARQTQLRSTALSGEVERAVRGTGLINDRGSLSRLPFTRDEAEAILELAPPGQGIKAVDFKANRSTVLSPDLSQYRIIHLATHGVINAEQPELSGLVLSLVDEEGKSQNGFLRLHEVYNLNWRAELVVLSACQTALGKDVRGEGLVGLTRGFMYAGSKRVLASLWNVNDSVTAQLMKQFYQGLLRKGLTPAAALRAAQVEMWKRKSWKAPYYWAAFVLQGDWK